MQADGDPSWSRINLSQLDLLDTVCDRYSAQLAAGGGLGFGDCLEGIPGDCRQLLTRELFELAMEHANTGQPFADAQRVLQANDGLREVLQPLADGWLEVLATAAPPAGSPVRRGSKPACPACHKPIDRSANRCEACGRAVADGGGVQPSELAFLTANDRFRAERRLGAGAFGAVWLVWDRSLRRRVAIKAPKSSRFSDPQIEIFRREARLAAQLEHPNIVPVYDLVEAAGRVAIIAKYIEGQSLDLWLSRNSLSHQTAAKLAQTISKAVHYAHGYGVVHRDLKPANILMTAEGVPMITDYGLAKADSDEFALDAGGGAVGTPAYMAPEQEDRAFLADARSDVYSLGVVLFELLTGERPFRGDRRALRRLRSEVDAPNARSLVSTVPIDLATIAAKCLERLPENRYQSADELASELGRFRDRKPIVARPISPAERSVRWARRNPLKTLLGALTVFLAIAGPATAIWIGVLRDRVTTTRQDRDQLVIGYGREEARRSQELATLRNDLESRTDGIDFWRELGVTRFASGKRLLVADFLSSTGPLLARLAGDVTISDAARLRAAWALFVAESAAAASPEEAIAAANNAQSLVGAELLSSDQPMAVDLQQAIVDATVGLESSAGRTLTTKSGVDAVRQRRATEATGAGRRLLDLIELLELEFSTLRAVGDAEAGSRFKEILALRKRMKNLWPTELQRAFPMACWLSGRFPSDVIHELNTATDDEDPTASRR